MIEKYKTLVHVRVHNTELLDLKARRKYLNKLAKQVGDVVNGVTPAGIIVTDANVEVVVHTVPIFEDEVVS